jgi:hypothetical protein
MKPVITAPGESLPGAAVPGATTVTPEPSADAQDGAELDGAELDGDVAALAVALVAPPAADELELLDEQPASASRVTVPQASAAAPAFPIPRLLIIVYFRSASFVKKQHLIVRKDALTSYFARYLHNTSAFPSDDRWR